MRENSSSFNLGFGRLSQELVKLLGVGYFEARVNRAETGLHTAQGRGCHRSIVPRLMEAAMSGLSYVHVMSRAAMTSVDDAFGIIVPIGCRFRLVR